MTPPLPSWAADPRAGIEREVAPYREMPFATKAALLHALCRDGMRLLAARDDADAARRWRDPLPESSVRALVRLRREFREREGR